MLHFLKTHKPFFTALIVMVMGLQSCAYYNTFYNAEEYYAEAQKLTRENQSENVSTQEINLYSKSIEKSKKLLQGYPDSKYRDDAQFLIARSYYYKGDFSLAKRYFEDLARNYSSSPHTDEVPLWIGRCLLEVGDLEMARHEASRIVKRKTSRSLQSDALLLMGEIAIRQDSLALAENYLEQVIDRSPDGFTKAQAQFQVGKMRENQLDYQGALTAYQAVARYRPSESLKVEAIIRQTNMLKALDRDADAIEMIQDMLVSDKFVDIRGQLEVELAKLYLVMDEVDLAEEKLKTIIEDYSRLSVAAEADLVLGDLYLTRKLDYKAARAAFVDIKVQSVRSPLVRQGVERVKQITHYEKIQFDYVNFQRQLAGLAPLVKEKKKKSSPGRSSRSSRSRGRTRSTQPGNPNAQNTPKQATKPKTDAPVETVIVTHEDSLNYLSDMDENRYSLAEYMLFEFARVDSALDILNTLEGSTLDSSIMQQSAYMQYYVYESVKGDINAGQQELDRIQISYPDYYTTIMNEPIAEDEGPDADELRFQGILELFDAGQYIQASQQYLTIKNDSTLSENLRSKSCFNYAWLNDHFLYDKEAAISAYTYMGDNFSTVPLASTARSRLKILTQEVIKRPNPVDDINPGQDTLDQEQPVRDDEEKIPKGPKKGEKEK